jgi:hypothetical protein
VQIKFSPAAVALGDGEIALGLGRAMRKPVGGGFACGPIARRALASCSEVDNLGHIATRGGLQSSSQNANASPQSKSASHMGKHSA